MTSSTKHYQAVIHTALKTKQIPDGTDFVGVQTIDLYTQQSLKGKLVSTTYTNKYTELTREGRTIQGTSTKSLVETSNRYDLNTQWSLNTFIADKEFLVAVAKAQKQLADNMLSKLELFREKEINAVESVINNNQGNLSDFEFGKVLTETGIRVQVTFKGNLLSFYYKEGHEFYEAGCALEISCNNYCEFNFLLEEIEKLMSMVIIIVN